MAGIRDDYLDAKTIHTRHVFDCITVHLVLTARVMTKTTGEESMTIRAKHFCTSKIVLASKIPIFFVLHFRYT